MLSSAVRGIASLSPTLSNLHRQVISRWRSHTTARKTLQGFHGRQCQVFHTYPRHYQSEIHASHRSDELEKYKQSLDFPKKSFNVRDIPRDIEDGLDVVIHGYLGTRSDLSKRLSFATIQDVATEDRIQVVSAPSSIPNEVHDRLKSIRQHEPVVIQGQLKPKPLKKAKASDHSSGNVPEREVELHLEKIQLLNELSPGVILKEDAEYTLEQRHLRLRTSSLLRNTLALRDRIMRLCHDALQDFLFVETPLLFKSTSEGANEFVIPTRRKGLAYALPQSPQQFKQILMASGISKYYQIARCFRDEDLRHDRQPEFTQLDMEMSFATSQNVIDLVTNQLIRKIWSQVLSVEMPSVFPVMTYQQAMSDYGSDKPDLRIPFKIRSSIQASLSEDFITNISSIEKPAIDVLVVPLENSPQRIRQFTKYFLDSPCGATFASNPDGSPGILIYDSRQPLQGLSALGFESAEAVQGLLGDMSDGTLLVFQARPNEAFTGGSTQLGNMRIAIHNAAIDAGILPELPWKYFEPLWIIDFPLFSPSSDDAPGQGGKSGLASTHHPFTSPKTAKDVDILMTNPNEAIGDHYDLVINGEEVGGGSRRIHHAAMQEFIFRDVLKMEESKIQEFAPLLNALKAACPPHAGIALGFDRMVAMLQSHLQGTKLPIRDTIAFPKTGSGEDPMTKSPGALTEKDLERYHLKLGA